MSVTTIELGDVVDVAKGISYRSSDYTDADGGLPFINLKCVGRGGGFRYDGIKYYAGTPKADQYVDPGDILIANTDLTQNREVIGSPIVIPDIGGVSCFSLDLSKLKIKRPDMVDVRWLFYYLKSAKARSYMISHSNGSTVSHLNTKSVPKMGIDLPDMATQRKIADILGSLDDKIELNRQMNETLEQIGQALFRHYFIDNPDAKNWLVVAMGDVLSTLESGSRPKGGAVHCGVPSIGAENIVGLGKYDYSKEKYISNDYFNKLKRGKIQSGDVLLYKDGAYVGRKSMFGNGFPHAVAAVNEHVFIMRTNERLPSQAYLYFWLCQPKITELIVSSGVKAAQPGINQNNVCGLPIVVPPMNILGEFNKRLSPILTLLFSNSLQSKDLAQVRDLAIGRLIH